MKYILISCILLQTSFTFSQVLTGKITDVKGAVILSASVRIENSSYETVSDKNGVYLIELKQGKYFIKFSTPGFEMYFDTVDVFELKTVKNITLEPINLIDEITVIPKSSKEKGKEIMKQVIDKRTYFQELLSEYSCDTYCFSSLEKEKFDSLIEILVVGNESLNMIEWRAKTSYKSTSNFKDEFYAYNDFSDPSRKSNFDNQGPPNDGRVGETISLAPQSNENSNPYLFVRGIKDAHFSIFENSIYAPKLTQNPLVSPLAFNAFLYYSFYLEKSFIDSTNQLVYQIKVKPIFSYEALFEGTLFIRDKGMELISYDLVINPGVLLFYNDIRIKCDYEKNGERLVPIKREFTYTIKEGKEILKGLIRVRHSDYSFDLGEKKSSYWLETAVYTADAFEKDSSFWNQKRPFTLKGFEKSFMHNQDSIIRYHETEEYMHKNDSLRNRFNLKSAFIGNGFYRVNSFNKSRFVIIPILAQIQPFGVGGFRYRMDVEYQKEFKNNKIISVNPNIDYGFLNKDVKGSFIGSLMYNPLNFSKIGCAIGDVYESINNTQNVMSVFIPTNKIRNQKIEINYSRELLNGLYLKTSLLYSDRQAIGDLQTPGWIKEYGSFIFQTPQVFDRYKILLATFDFEYHIQSKYMIKKGKKVVYGSPWPILYLTYKKGIPSIFNSNSNFDFLQFKIQDDINLKSFGTSQFTLEAGTYLQKKELRTIEYRYFRPSDNFFFSNPINTLQLLDTSLRTPNSYIQFNFIHHFNGFFLNKVWLINKLKLEESFGGSFLTIPTSNFTHAEFFMGIERKFRVKRQIFKIGCYFVTGDSNIGNALYHFKIGINGFNNFNNKWDY